MALEQDLTRWRWVKARIQLLYGSWLRRQRRVSEARLPLRSALTTLTSVGAALWVKQAESELRAAGDRLPTGDRERQAQVTHALSAQEWQIARLAAEGLSNREIGERLFMSHRTVGSHLYHIFPKLNITSRVQLASQFTAGPDL